MKEDLGGPYPGDGLGAMDAYDGYVSYPMLDDDPLAPGFAQMRDLMECDWRTLQIEQDLGLGMMRQFDLDSADADQEARAAKASA